MKRRLVLTLALSLAPFAVLADADPLVGGNAEAGAKKAVTCAACHGPKGNSAMPEWPKLAGQHAKYTYAQLQHLKSGMRSSPLMGAQAAALSDQDMKDLAAYFAAQTPSPGVASEAAIAVAEPLYRHGDAARGLPACGACHGPAGAGNAAAAYPRIGGQHAAYTSLALRMMKAELANPLPNPSPILTMATIANNLTEAEMDALASYINGLQ